MHCPICSIKNKNKKAGAEIERFLYINNGTLTQDNKNELCENYPDLSDDIEKIQDKDCNVHWNFHASISIEDESGEDDVKEVNGEKVGKSLTADIDKTEGYTLKKLFDAQASTFLALTNKINEAVTNAEAEDLNKVVINPVTVQLYKETGDSLRATMKEIRQFNADLNGSKSDSLSGLKALVGAISSQKGDTEDKDLTTDEFDAE